MDATPYDPALLIDGRYLRAAAPAQVASPNERAVLRQIWDEPGLSRADLIGRIDVTQQSLHRIVDQLVERRLVRLGPPRPGSGRGQPSPTLSLDATWALTAGVSVNTDRAGVTVMDLTGRRETRSVDIAKVDLETSLSRISEALIALRARWQPALPLFGIGFGISGYRIGGTRFNPPEPLADWAMIELGPLLAERFGVPVWTENGANLSAMAEAALGIGRTVRDFAYLSFNYGFGGAVFVDGRLLAGHRGNAGEFSGMFDPEDNRHRPALGLLIESLRHEGIEIGSMSELRERFDPNWPGVAPWLDRVMPQLNRLLNALSAINDPEVIVLGGEIPFSLAEVMLDRVEFWSMPRFGIPRAVPNLVISKIGDEPASIGGASLPLLTCLF